MRPSLLRISLSFLCLALLLLPATVRAEDPKPKEEKPIEPKEKVELFNGKNLDGWVSHLAPDSIAVSTPE